MFHFMYFIMFYSEHTQKKNVEKKVYPFEVCPVTNIDRQTC